MNALTVKLQASPLLARVLPFVVFLVLTSCQGSFGPESHFWVYLAKCVVGAWMIWVTWPLVSEMRWTISFEALSAGVLVFLMWVTLPKFSKPDDTWNLLKHYESSPAMVWAFAGVRIAGSTLLVPMLEEVFYRSFLYRYILAPNWMFTAHNSFHIKPFLLTSVIFGFTHQHWIAGIICGIIYQSLVLRTNRIGDAITAHATTNFLLGVWVITQGFGYADEPQWYFW
ncbi:MAG TPA: CAAX prenyl protease-related protein [Verrucomicrobiota bacterium]|nr:CAAX prenyl protease-related protein [Verrucomicrobiota bacterium]